jgi:Protein of unknown function/AsmA-like C-terminal region
VKRFVLFTVTVLLLLLLAAGGAGLWLATRTIDISRFAPRIAAQIETAAPGMTVRLGQISARRDALRGAVAVIITDSIVQHPQLGSPASVASIHIDLALLPLLRGQVRLRSVEVRGLRATTRLSLRELFKSNDSQQRRTMPWAPGLKSVKLADASFKIHDTDTAVDFDVQVPTLAAYQNLFGGDVRLAGQVALASNLGTVPMTLKATATPHGNWQADVRGDIMGAMGIAQALRPELDLPESLPPMTLAVSLRQQDRLAADISLDVGAGHMVWPTYYAKPLTLQRLTAQATWHEDIALLKIPAFTALVDQLSLSGSASLNLDSLARSSANARFDRLSPRLLTTLWPQNLAIGGRRWIDANIKSGDIRDGRLMLLPKGKLTFNFKMQNLRATYRTPMPPLVNATGNGRLTEKGLTLDFSQGSINGLNIVPAQVVIEDWSVSPNMMRVDMGLHGDLPNLLTVLDSKPLGFISRYGVAPASTKGSANGRLSLRFPLINALRTDEIDIQAKATTTSAMLPDVYAGHALNQADLQFEINSTGMIAVGKGLVGPQPISLRWTEDFTGTKTAPSRYEIKAQSSVATLAQLDIDISGLASGPLLAEVDLEMKGPKMLRGQFRADARAATFDMPFFGRLKAAGVPAQVAGSMVQQGQQLIIDSLSVASVPVTLRGEARVPLAKGRSQFEIGQFTFGRNRMSGAVSFGDGGPLSLQIYGGTLDARPLLRGFSSAGSGPAVVSTAPNLRNEINAKLDVVEMLGDINMKNLNAQATVLGDTLTRLTAIGKVGGVAEARADLVSNGASRVLTLSSSDAGQMGRALDLFKTGQGGALDLVADIRGSNATLAINGRARVRNMRVTDTPVMARMLTMASLTGILDTAAGRGILFETMDVPFKLQNGIIDVKEARAIGPGLGLTLEGQLQQSLATLNLRGVIIPSYTLNAAIGKIPVLGSVLTGGKDQGLIGFNYRITGSATKPLVDVQTSSALALGPLRRLFQGKAAKVSAEAKTTAKEAGKVQ